MGENQCASCRQRPHFNSARAACTPSPRGAVQIPTVSQGVKNLGKLYEKRSSASKGTGDLFGHLLERDGIALVGEYRLASGGESFGINRPDLGILVGVGAGDG